MVHAIQQGTGELAVYAGILEQCLLGDGEPQMYVNERTGKTVFLRGPAAVYGIYQSFCLKVKQESSR